MQRLSLGSLPSKIQLSGGGGSGGATGRAAERRQQQQQQEEEIKAEKQIRWSPRADRSIHLIPVLTLLCLLVLFLFSHDPSPEDLEAFVVVGSGLHYDAKAVSGSERVSAVHSIRGLKTAVRNRKLGMAQPGVRT